VLREEDDAIRHEFLLYDRRNSKWIYLALAFDSLFSLAWFRFKPVDYADMSLATTLLRPSYGWIVDKLAWSAGGVNPDTYPFSANGPAGIVYTLVVNMMHSFAPLWFAQFVYIALVLFVGQVGVFWLIRHLTEELRLKTSGWVFVLTSAFYVYGPWYQFVIGDGAFLPTGFFAAYPFLVYFCIRAAESFPRDRRGFLGSALGLCAAGLLGSFGFTYYYYLTGIGSVALFGVLWVLVVKRGVRRRLESFLGLVLALVVLQLSLFYVLPQDFSSAPTLAQVSSASPNLYKALFYNSRLMGYLTQLTVSYWPAPQPWVPVRPNVPAFLTSPFWGFALFLVLVYPLVSRGFVRRSVLLPFYVVLLIAVVLGAGVSPPFGGAVTWLFLHFWPFRVITQPFTSLNFVDQLCFSALLGAGFAGLSQARLKRGSSKQRMGWAITALLLVGLAGFAGVVAPYVSGSPISIVRVSGPSPTGQGEQTFNVTPRVSVPSYYYALVGYLNSLPVRGAVLLLPIGGNFHSSTWYLSVDMLGSVLNKPVVGGGFVSTPETAGLVGLVTAWEQGSPLNLSSVLWLEGVGYIVVQGDSASSPPGSPEPPFNLGYIESALNSSVGIGFLARFGPDSVYEVGSAAGSNYWGSGGSQAAGGSSVMAYGFSVENRAAFADPAPSRPFDVLFNLSGYYEGDSAGSGCGLLSGASALQYLVHGNKSYVNETCTFPLKASSAFPVYLSFNYTAQQGVNFFVWLVSNRSVGEAANLSGEQVFPVKGGSGVVTTTFPPGSYRALVVGLVTSEVFNLSSPLAKLGWLYLSLGLNSEELAPVSAANGTVYVYPWNGSSTNAGLSWAPNTAKVVDSAKPPRVLSWSCGVLRCEALVNASHPFLFTYYEAYSPDVRLEVNGSSDPSHYIVLGSFNGWVVPGGGLEHLVVTRSDPLLPWELVALATWVVVAALYVWTRLSSGTPRQVGAQSKN
jgi:hypothetical protein